MEAFKYFNKNNQYYKQIFFTIVTLIVILILMLSIVLYFNFENIILSQSNIFIMDNLSKISYSTTFMSESANILLTQLYKDTQIQNFFYNISTDPLNLYLSNVRLRSFRNLVPYVQSIYVYNGTSKKVYYDSLNGDTHENESTRFYDNEIFDIIRDKSRGIPNTPIPRIMKANTTYESNYNVYTYILYEMPVTHSDNDNFIAVNISEDWMRKIIDSLDAKQQGEIFIINSEGQTVSSTEHAPICTNLSREEYIKKIINSKARSGYFVDKVNGIKSLVTYVSSNDKRLDWKYLHVIPYDIITKSTEVLKVKTILISSIIILFGLMITIFTSSKLYKPFDAILENLKKLKTESQKSRNILKQSFLRNLINMEDPQNQKLDEFDLNVDLSGNFIVIGLRIDHYSDFYSKYGYKDRNLFKFAIMNIASELCSTNFKNETIDMEKDHIVILLNTDDANPDYKKELDELIGKIQAAVLKNLKISLSVMVNQVPGSLENLSLRYKELTNILDMRMFYGHGCIIYSDMITVRESGEYSYPEQKEKALTSSLMLRNIDKTVTIFNDIIGSTEGYSYAIVNMVMYRLTLAINTAIDKNKIGKDMSISYNFNDFTAKLNDLETVKEIKEQFYSMFEYLIRALEEIKTTNRDYLANKVAKMIEANYKDMNISTESLASTLGLSGDYIGRMFKLVKGVSIAEYINNARMEEARELLNKTNKSVNDIMEEVGFQNNSYFYILFKKHTGITPAEYRQRTRESQL